MRQRQQRLRADNVIRGGLLHHPARHVRQRPVRLANNKYLRPCETLPLQDLHALTVARVIPVKDPPIGVVILGSMPLVRAGQANRISAPRSARPSSRTAIACCSPAPPTSSSASRPPARHWRWRAPSTSSTSST